MKFVCNKCLGLISEKNIIRMPFDNEDKYWCKWCHNDWAKDDPGIGTAEKIRTTNKNNERRKPKKL